MGRNRAKKTTDLHTETPADETAADAAVATDSNDVFAEAINAAQARQETAPAETNGHEPNGFAAQHAPSGNGHAAQHAPGVILNPSATRVNGEQEQPRRPSSEMITDAAAKMRLHSNHTNYKVAITFDDGKPSDPVREVLKASGFRWNGDETAWEKTTSFETRVRDRLDAERTFNAVAELRMQEMGVTVQR